MNSSSARISVLIVGATGNLGTLLAKEGLKQSNIQVNVLVRNPDKLGDLGEEIKKSGGNIIKGDISDVSSLKDVTKGIHTIISAFTVHDSKTYIDGHIALIKDAEANGVSRFVTNSFSVYSYAVPREETSQYAMFENKSKVEDYLQTTSLKKLSIFCGTFMETFFLYQKFGSGYWGEPGHVNNLTSYADTAAYIMAAVANKDQDGVLCISGDELTVEQAVAVYNKVRGTNAEIKRNGSLADLKKMFEDYMSQKDYMKAAFMGLYLMVYDERTHFTKNDNDKYPEVKLNSFEEFVKQHPDQVL